MQVDFAVLADYAIIDRLGKLSVMGIFQHVWVPNFPSIHPKTHLVVRLKGSRDDVGEHKIDIEFTDVTGKTLIKGSGRVTFAEPPPLVTEIDSAAVLVFDVPLETEGRYEFVITVDDEVSARVPLTAAKAHQQNPPAAPPSAGFQN